MTIRGLSAPSVALFFVVGCAAGGGSSATEAPAPSQAAAPEASPPAPPEPEFPPEVVAGERVSDIRLAQDPIVIEVGQSIGLRDLQPVPVDADGIPVQEAPLLFAPIEGSAAALQGQNILGVVEGEAHFLFAVSIPGRAGEQDYRMFPKTIVVRGQPIASMQIVPPEETVYSGTAVPLSFVARTSNGTVRSRVAAVWTTRNPETAAVSEGGVVRGLRAGQATIAVTAEGFEATLAVDVVANPVRSVDLVPSAISARTGDVVRFEAVPLTASGSPVNDIALTYAVGGGGPLRGPLGASVYPDGALVAEIPGTYRLAVNAGGVSAEAIVEVAERGVRADAHAVGVALVPEAPSSDLWVFRGRDGRDYAYVGTHAGGQRMFAWDVTNPADPVLMDSVVVDARVVNDVKVNEDATLAVITREGASDRRNGMMILDIADPAHPSVLSTYTENLTGGVHNTFIVGDIVYAIHDGTLDVHIVDISDPTAPREVGRWGIDNPTKYLHDIWVVDGIGYVSYWDDGVYLLDLGDGRWGGTPTDPVVISSYAYPEGHTHVAFPYTNSDGHSYLFAGDEIFDCEECVSRTGTSEEGPRGFVHVISIDDLENPVEVAKYDVPEAGVHNIWVEDDRLYAAYYQGGLRVVDISGELRGDLYRQGREIAWFSTGHPDAFSPNSPMAWGPQPYNGNIFVSDLNSGLWVVRLDPRSGGAVLP